jgi:hypothetical protein
LRIARRLANRIAVYRRLDVNRPFAVRVRVTLPLAQLEGWWFVSFGDAVGGVVAVQLAFGGDGSGFVVRAGVSASGHHGTALAG